MVFLSRVISSIQVMGINMVALCEGLSVGQKAGLSGKDILEARAQGASRGGVVRLDMAPLTIQR